MGKIVGFEIGDHSVKLVYFAGNELKKAVCAELPDAMVSHGRGRRCPCPWRMPIPGT